MTDIKKGFRTKGGDVSSFRKESQARAKALGYSKSTKGTVDTFTKGEVTITVVHSEKHYVQKVTLNGEAKVIPGDAKKHIKLQALLIEQAGE